MSKTPRRHDPPSFFFLSMKVPIRACAARRLSFPGSTTAIFPATRPSRPLFSTSSFGGLFPRYQSPPLPSSNTMPTRPRERRTVRKFLHHALLSPPPQDFTRLCVLCPRRRLATATPLPRRHCIEKVATANIPPPPPHPCYETDLKFPLRPSTFPGQKGFSSGDRIRQVERPTPFPGIMVKSSFDPMRGPLFFSIDGTF